MDLDQRIKILFLKNGVLLGVVLLSLSIISYYFITQLTTSPVLFIAAPILLSLFLPIVAVVLICIKGRNSIGGYWTFKQATTGIFIMFIIAYAIQFIGKDVIFNKFIEPDNVQKTQAAAINAKTTILKQQGKNHKYIDENIGEMRKEFVQQQNVTIGSTIQGIVISILFIFLFALIFGSLFKKEPPVYSLPVNEEQ